MAHNLVGTLVDDNGNCTDPTATKAIPTGVGTTIVKNGPGRLCRVVVTGAVPTGALTFYDSVGSATGTVLAVVPASGVASGQVFSIEMPAAIGITAVGASGSAVATVSYS